MRYWWVGRKWIPSLSSTLMGLWWGGVGGPGGMGNFVWERPHAVWYWSIKKHITDNNHQVVSKIFFRPLNLRNMADKCKTKFKYFWLKYCKITIWNFKKLRIPILKKLISAKNNNIASQLDGVINFIFTSYKLVYWYDFVSCICIYLDI